MDVHVAKKKNYRKGNQSVFLKFRNSAADNPFHDVEIAGGINSHGVRAVELASLHGCFWKIRPSWYVAYGLILADTTYQSIVGVKHRKLCGQLRDKKLSLKRDAHARARQKVRAKRALELSFWVIDLKLFP
ncbi:MAG: hypothetical protein HW374_1703 [Bacteroidetes bacterium]|nr:hypothetical protein [Bacteroidota bacterium]